MRRMLLAGIADDRAADFGNADCFGAGAEIRVTKIRGSIPTGISHLQELATAPASPRNNPNAFYRAHPKPETGSHRLLDSGA